MTYSYQVPVTYTVNVTVTQAPAGLAGYNTNAIALFSNDAANFPETYRAYISPDAVKTDFGSSSLTYKMATALFTPAPNFRTGGGVLYIFKFGGVNATAGKVTTGDISANITKFAAVTNGYLQLTIDGTATELQNLNFTGVATLQDIADVIKGANADLYVDVVGNTIVLQSKRFGTASGVTISTASGGTDLSGADYLNATGATTTAGTNASGETLANAVTTALQQTYFGGVLTTQYTDDTTLLANSSAIQGKDCDYFEAMTSLKNIAVTGASIKSAGNGKTRTLAYSTGAEAAKIAVATYATIAKSVNYTGSRTTQTMNLKTLTGVLADGGLNDTYLLSANTNGVDVYGNTGGLSVVYSNDNNGYTDDIENQLWFKKAIEVVGFNYLRQTNTKIPQTEEGMTGLKSVYEGICSQANTNGMSAPGTWNSAMTFGNPEDFKRNIEEKGYYIYSLPVAKQSQVDREARKAPLVQIAIKLAGAFHFSDVVINVER